MTAVLTATSLPLRPGDSVATLDGSWVVAMSLAHVQGLRYGPDLAFTYGPLGMLAVPQDFYLRGAVLAVPYAAATGACLYWALLRSASRWLPAWSAVALTAAIALAAPQKTPELGVLALVLVAFDVLHPARRQVPLPTPAPIVLGALAALQLLVKVGAGASFVVVTAVIVLARAGRWRAAALAGGTFALASLLLWLAAGQRLGDLAVWLRRSVAIAAGYDDAMAIDADAGPWPWVLLAALAVAVAAWAADAVRREGRARLPMVLVLAWACWFFAKQGYVRADDGHRDLTVWALAAIVASLGWRSWTRPVAAVAVVLCVGILVADTDDLARQHGGASNALRTARMSVDRTYRDERVAGHRANVLRAYGLAPDAVSVPGSMHADAYDAAVVWALQREWRPVPAFQLYVAYDTVLDDANAAAILGDHAPDVIVHLDGAIDHHFPPWESPAYQLAVTCTYDVAADAAPWRVLRHRAAGDRCRAAARIEQVRVDDGATVDVPAPRSPTSLVVATFDYPESVLEAIATTAFRPLRLPAVELDGVVHRFLPSLGDQPHLLLVPPGLPNEGIAIGTIAFPDAPGSTVVTFYEIPLTDSSWAPG